LFDVCNAVTVGHEEGVVFQVVSQIQQPATGTTVVAGIHQSDFPRLSLVVVHGHTVIAHIECYVRYMQVVVGEVLLDHVPLVAAADNEIVIALRRIDLHDVPQDRSPSDLDHRFRLDRGFFGQPCAQSTR
jgi:hypothetical protein